MLRRHHFKNSLLLFASFSGAAPLYAQPVHFPDQAIQNDKNRTIDNLKSSALRKMPYSEALNFIAQNFSEEGSIIDLEPSWTQIAVTNNVLSVLKAIILKKNNPQEIKNKAFDLLITVMTDFDLAYALPYAMRQKLDANDRAIEAAFAKNLELRDKARNFDKLNLTQRQHVTNLIFKDIRTATGLPIKNRFGESEDAAGETNGAGTHIKIFNGGLQDRSFLELMETVRHEVNHLEILRNATELNECWWLAKMTADMYEVWHKTTETNYLGDEGWPDWAYYVSPLEYMAKDAERYGGVRWYEAATGSKMQSSIDLKQFMKSIEAPAPQ